MKPCRCYLETRLWQLRIMSLKVVLILLCLALVSTLNYNLPFQNMIVYYYYLPIYYNSFNISNNFYYLVSFRFFNATLIVAVKYEEDKSRPICKAEGLIIYLFVGYFLYIFLTVHSYTCLFACLLFYWFVYLVVF